MSHFLVRHDFLNSSLIAPHWNKVFAIKAALQEVADGDWIVWSDTKDVLIGNLEKPPDEWLHELLSIACPLHHQRQPGHCHILVQGEDDDMLFNNGVLLFRKSCWTMKFLDLWWSLLPRCAVRPFFDNGPFMFTIGHAILRGIDLNRSYIDEKHRRSSRCFNDSRIIPYIVQRSSQGVCVIPRSNTTAQIQVGLWKQGDIRGFIHYQGSSRPAVHHEQAECLARTRATIVSKLPHNSSVDHFTADHCGSVVSLATLPAADLPGCNMRRRQSSHTTVLR